MFDKLLFRLLAAGAVMTMWTASAQGVTIDLVPIGNPGNPGEMSGASAVGQAVPDGTREVSGTA